MLPVGGMRENSPPQDYGSFVSPFGSSLEVMKDGPRNPLEKISGGKIGEYNWWERE